MKKNLVISIVFLAMLILSACVSNTATAAEQSSNAAAVVASTASTAVLDASYSDSVSVELQLLYGIMKLEDTDQKISAEQAAALLPLWQSLQTGPGMMGGATGTSSTQQAPTTLTQDEIDAVLTRIEAVLTNDQINTIAGMKVTQAMIDTYISDNAQAMGGGQMPGGQAPAGSQGGNGQAPQGTPPADMGSGQAPQGGQMPGGSANGQQPDMSSGVLVNAVISLLQQKTGSTSTSTNSGSTTGQQPVAGAPGGSDSSSANITAAYTVDGQTLSEDGKTYNASAADQSAILVTNGGSLTVTNATVTSSGNSSSTDNSSFYGQNAAVLAQANSTITMSGSTISTSGIGANGAFATGTNSLVTLSEVTITATGNGGHAVMATQGGSMVLNNVTMTTSGGSSSAVATDRGGGTITVNGGTVKVSGNNSAGIYSTGSITANDATFTASGAEAAVIEGANSIVLNNCTLTSTYDNKWGVMIYQSMSGDAQGSEGTYTMSGGSLSYTGANGPLFYITNTTANINLSGVALNAVSGVLIKAAAGNWGNSGSNGGTVILTADGQTLTGNVIADAISSVTMSLKNGSSLTGAVNSDKTAKSVSITLDGTSTWTLTGDSHVTTLSGALLSGTTVTNITGNGHNLYYDTSSNPSLNGQTYSLAGGGSLIPAK